MRLDFYKEFLALAESQSFSKAASKLGIQQGTLSKHMKSIEEEYGVPLFSRRNKNNVELLEFGELLIPYAKRICEICRYQFPALAEQTMIDIPSVKFRIGVSSSVVFPALTDIIIQFQKDYPSVFFVCKEDNSKSLKDDVWHEACDFAIIRDTSHQVISSFNQYTIQTDFLVAAIPSDNPLSAYPEIDFFRLEHEKIILPSENSSEYNVFVDECRKNNFEAKVVHYGIAQRKAFDLAARGVGIAILWDSYTRNLPANNVVFSKLIPVKESRVNILYKPDNNNPLLNAYTKSIRSVFETL